MKWNAYKYTAIYFNVIKFIDKLIMGHIGRFSYTNTHIHPITNIYIHYKYSYVNTKLYHDTRIYLFTILYLHWRIKGGGARGPCPPPPKIG